MRLGHVEYPIAAWVSAMALRAVWGTRPICVTPCSGAPPAPQSELGANSKHVKTAAANRLEPYAPLEMIVR